MTTKKEEQLSAQVILRSAKGAAPDSEARVTAENVDEYLPSSASAKDARRAFQEAGFEVGELVGNSFSITAPRSKFEKLFKVKVQPEKGEELPVNKLAEDLRRHVAHVTFTPPPDFGPTSYA